MANRHHLSDLSALVSGQQWRRRRRSRGHHRAAPYLRWLGVDAIWISPIYPSPMADFGYDVTDYMRHRSAVRHAGRFRRAAARGARARPEGHPRLRAEPHLRPASLVHREPRARATIPKRDWYIWRDPAPDGGPPNNWLSHFGGSAWAVRRGDRAILLPRLPQGAARPQLAQPGRSARPCSTCCASGSTAASMAFAST